MSKNDKGRLILQRKPCFRSSLTHLFFSFLIFYFILIGFPFPSKDAVEDWKNRTCFAAFSAFFSFFVRFFLFLTVGVIFLIIEVENNREGNYVIRKALKRDR